MMAIDQKVREYTPKFRDIVAKAWSDEGFKARLLSDPKAVLVEQGIELPADNRVRLIAPSPDAQHMLLPPKTEQELGSAARREGHVHGPVRVPPESDPLRDQGY